MNSAQSLLNSPGHRLRECQRIHTILRRWGRRALESFETYPRFAAAVRNHRMNPSLPEEDAIQGSEPVSAARHRAQVLPPVSRSTAGANPSRMFHPLPGDPSRYFDEPNFDEPIFRGSTPAAAFHRPVGQRPGLRSFG
jgi:hypothetical protein